MNTENQTTSGDQELTPEKVLRSVDDAFEVHEAITTIEIFGQQRYQQGLKDADQSKWIPVEERLPVSEDMEQEAIKVLASFKSGSVTEVFYNFYTGTWENFERWKYSNDATHWQPLPSAPDLQEQGREEA